MMSRPHVQPYFSNSLAIRQEIQRFESVHPAMYLIYDLIEEIPDQDIAQQLKDLIVCIEDSFVSSQEWTLSREVPDLRLGIVGNLFSGKSALVHRYLTGSYMHEESPEGGRFKKEVSIDGQSYLLLIRDEGGTPELQFTAWVDAVIFVFSLENESSFNSIYNYYGRMLRHRNITEIPLILVGTQDAISETKPRIIDDVNARKLATDLKISTYYETCATYGLNIDRVFQDACTKVIQQRLNLNLSSSSRPPALHYFGRTVLSYPPPPAPPVPLVTGALNSMPPNSGTGSNNGFFCSGPTQSMNVSSSTSSLHSGLLIPASTSNVFLKDPVSYPIGTSNALQDPVKSDTVIYHMEDMKGVYSSSVPYGECISSQELNKLSTHFENFTITLNKDQKDLPTPSSTPTTSRKSRRRSNLFNPSKKDDDKKQRGEELGSGRAIPLKQGYLYKKSSKSLNREWKKKYVTLSDDGHLTYHANIHDYMENVHGKDISLQYTTVKVPGQKQRLTKPVSSAHLEGASLTLGIGKEKKGDKVTLTGYEAFKDNKCPEESMGPPGMPSINGDVKMETPNVKKRHRRMRSSGIRAHDCEDSDGYEFSIVSLDNKQWHFEALSCDERDDWVLAIKQQIFSSLHGNESSKSKFRSSSLVDPASVQALRTSIEGNDRCADCGAPGPDWASLNLGILICIECSGMHRNLGSHISRVRSLDLDEWPPGHISVMLALGNRSANSVWEANLKGRTKPNPASPRQEKESWIRHKYEQKEFLRAMASSLLPEQLFEAVARQDARQVYLLLANLRSDQLPCVISRDGKTPLHVSCALGNLPISQLLLWHNVNIAAQDYAGNVSLVYAKNSGCAALVELLMNVSHPRGEIPTVGSNSSGSGTIPRRKGSFSRKTDAFDKLPASVI